MTPAAVAELVAALGGGGLVVALVDRWRYRGRPQLDVAALAQQLAETTLAHARTEIDRAWSAVERYEHQVDELRAEVGDLRRRVERQDADAAALREQLRQRVAELATVRAALAARDAVVAELRGEVSRMTGLTQHAQATAGRRSQEENPNAV